MIQDLDGKRLKNEFHDIVAEQEDMVFIFDAKTKANFMVIEDENGKVELPKAKDFNIDGLQYLFAIGDEKYFLYMGDENDSYEAKLNLKIMNVRNLRATEYKELAMASATAYHLYQWYSVNKFCGRCGQKTVHDKSERMLKCPICGNAIYPKIAPAVIVGVTSGNRLLLTKYSGRAYKRYALIAGFTEIGETAEETVIREVKEEVGLSVKNVRYYASQPWGSDSNLLLGYYCDLDGDDDISLDENELAVAEWFERDEIPFKDDGYSLTGEMIEAFQKGLV